MFDDSPRGIGVAGAGLPPAHLGLQLALGSLSSVALPSNCLARSVSKSQIFMPKINPKTTNPPLDLGSALIDDRQEDFYGKLIS
jgi:hypothetical protein